MNCVMHDKYGALNVWFVCFFFFSFFFSFLSCCNHNRDDHTTHDPNEIRDWLMQHHFAIVDLWDRWCAPLEWTCNFPFGIRVGRSHIQPPGIRLESLSIPCRERKVHWSPTLLSSCVRFHAIPWWTPPRHTSPFTYPNIEVYVCWTN